MYQNNKTILLIEDDPGIVELLKVLCAKEKFNTVSVSSAKEAKDYLVKNEPHIVLLDYSLPDKDGDEFIKDLLKSNINIPPFIVTTGRGDEKLAVEMMKLGATDYVCKDEYFLDIIAKVVKRVDNELANKVKLQKAEDELKTSKESYQILFERSSDAIFVVSRKDKKFEDLNKKAEELFGADYKELINSKMEDFFSVDREKVYTITDMFEVGEVIFRNLKDEFRAVLLSFSPINDKLIFGVACDITERKKADEELIEAKENAEKADRLKSTFLAQMSHEIRTPINTMVSLSSMLMEELEEKLNDDQSLSFKLVEKAGRRIIRTIDLLLNLSEIQTGSYKPVMKKFDIYSDIISNIIAEYRKVSKEKGLRLGTKMLTDDSELVADSYTINQIITQLVDNSIKYTEQGEVNIILKRDNDKLILEIKDTGIGINKEYLPELFTPFSQEEMGYTRKYEGNGIGLALVKTYCEINNAQIEVESEKDKGSIFRLIFN